jgi:hypothetical protein
MDSMVLRWQPNIRQGSGQPLLKKARDIGSVYSFNLSSFFMPAVRGKATAGIQTASPIHYQGQHLIIDTHFERRPLRSGPQSNRIGHCVSSDTEIPADKNPTAVDSNRKKTYF